MDSIDETTLFNIQARFISDTGQGISSPLNLPLNVTLQQLTIICNAVLQNEVQNDFLFFVNNNEIKESLKQSLDFKCLDTENILDIVYQPQAVFKIRPVTRCTSSMPGHSEAVVCLSFSPDGQHLASGSGDTTLRLWDLNTETPEFLCQGHKQWVLCVAWSPDGNKIASSCKAGEIRVWSPLTGKQIGKALIGHKSWINCISWEPYHCNVECRSLASAGKDSDIRIWDTISNVCLKVISGHTGAVTSVRWGGSGLLYSSSKDRTIKIWRVSDGILCKTLSGHAHWVNNLTLSTDYVIKTGPFHAITEKNLQHLTNKEVLQQMALEKYKNVCPDNVESLVSCSDDFTLFLWKSNQTKFISRMTGHQNVVNDVKYSPDTKFIASASFDKSIRLWKASDGSFIFTFRGHVQAVYTISWAADSRIFVSGSKDSTLKVWCVKTKTLIQELPGHGDEVFAVDWASDGSKVASGGKDKIVKLWSQ